MKRTTGLIFFLCVSAVAFHPETIPAAEKMRIISTAPSLTEIVFALGLGDDLVAVSDFCHYPLQAEKLPRIGGLLNPSLERIVELKPTLVLALSSLSRLGEQLGEIGVDNLVVKNNRLAEIFYSIERIGEACERTGAARRLRSRMESQLDLLRQRSAALPQRRVLIVVGRGPGSLRDTWIAGAQSYLGEVCGYANAILPAAKGGMLFRGISKEEIVTFDPEVIIDLSLVGKERSQEELAAAKRLWDKMPSLQAVKTGRIYLPLQSELVVPGPRLGRAAEILFELIHRK